MCFLCSFSGFYFFPSVFQTWLSLHLKENDSFFQQLELKGGFYILASSVMINKNVSYEIEKTLK